MTNLRCFRQMKSTQSFSKFIFHIILVRSVVFKLVSRPLNHFGGVASRDFMYTVELYLFYSRFFWGLLGYVGCYNGSLNKKR